jgi:hypothetical protein
MARLVDDDDDKWVDLAVFTSLYSVIRKYIEGGTSRANRNGLPWEGERVEEGDRVDVITLGHGGEGPGNEEEESGKFEPPPIPSSEFDVSYFDFPSIVELASIQEAPSLSPISWDEFTESVERTEAYRGQLEEVPSSIPIEILPPTKESETSLEIVIAENIRLDGLVPPIQSLRLTPSKGYSQFIDKMKKWLNWTGSDIWKAAYSGFWSIQTDQLWFFSSTVILGRLLGIHRGTVNDILEGLGYRISPRGTLPIALPGRQSWFLRSRSTQSLPEWTLPRIWIAKQDRKKATYTPLMISEVFEIYWQENGCVSPLPIMEAHRRILELHSDPYPKVVLSRNGGKELSSELRFGDLIEVSPVTSSLTGSVNIISPMVSIGG